jgi:hypothetical protein
VGKMPQKPPAPPTSSSSYNFNEKYYTCSYKWHEKT